MQPKSELCFLEQTLAGIWALHGEITMYINCYFVVFTDTMMCVSTVYSPKSCEINHRHYYSGWIRTNYTTEIARSLEAVRILRFGSGYCNDIIDVKIVSGIKSNNFGFYPYTNLSFSTVYSVLSRVL